MIFYEVPKSISKASEKAQAREALASAHAALLGSMGEVATEVARFSQTKGDRVWSLDLFIANAPSDTVLLSTDDRAKYGDAYPAMRDMAADGKVGAQVTLRTDVEPPYLRVDVFGGGEAARTLTHLGHATIDALKAR